MYSAAYKRYVTILLLGIYVFNQADRSIFSILMEPIRHELLLSDTQLGFLAGPALIVLYITLGVPISRFADRGHRVNIMTVSIAFWSCIVMLSATVARFWQLALTRVGVGIGEAGFSAIAQSLIADYHTPKERTRALSIFMLGIPLGGVVSYLMGGWVNQAFGWRLAFVVAGFPGIVLCLLLNRTVREPRRANISMFQRDTAPPLRRVLSVLWERQALRHLMIAQAVANVVLSCERSWLPAFLTRNHGLATGEVGSWMAVMEGVGGGTGIWLSGYLAGRFGAKDESIQARMIAVATLVTMPLVLMGLWCSSNSLAMILWLLSYIALLFFLAPTSALIQSLCESRMRATMTSLFILAQVLAGGVIGVQLLGFLSDVLAPTFGRALALRWAMTIASLFAPWAVVHFWLAGRAMRRDASLGDDETPLKTTDGSPVRPIVLK